MQSSVTDYQIAIKQKLEHFFGSGIQVKTEWPSITNIAGLYSPRIDIAVGPFSTSLGESEANQYNNLMEDKRDFIEKLMVLNNRNVSKYRNDDGDNSFYEEPSFRTLKEFNYNSRCFLAIEIENEVSRKHLLGGVVNACALGRIGICIGWTEKKVRAFVRLQMYWEYLKSVRKNTFGTGNLIILEAEQFEGIL